MASYSTKFSSQNPPIKSSKIKVSQISFKKEGKKDKKAFILKYYPIINLSLFSPMNINRGNSPSHNSSKAIS